MSPTALLPLLAIAALLALASAGVMLSAGLTGPPVAAHLAFASGVLPLILGAIGYFVPVLTRSAAPGFAAWVPPLLAWAGGLLAVYSFATDFSATRLGVAAGLAGLATLVLGGWTLTRTRRMFGPRHRGVDWYLAALGFLVLGLLAVALIPLFPAERNSLRLFHLHANLLGFVGITALGTLQVLLPTCLGQTDRHAASRLRTDLKWATGGALLIALGAFSRWPGSASMVAPTLALLGAACYGAVVLRMLRDWQTAFGTALLQAHGAAPSLAAAAFGLLGLLAFGVAHGFGGLPARPAVAGFVIAFLLPLVSGSAGHLLPVWLRPGVQGEWHRVLRTRLSRWGGVRALFLVVLGLAIAAVG